MSLETQDSTLCKGCWRTQKTSLCHLVNGSVRVFLLLGGKTTTNRPLLRNHLKSSFHFDSRLEIAGNLGPPPGLRHLSHILNRIRQSSSALFTCAAAGELEEDPWMVEPWKLHDGLIRAVTVDASEIWKNHQLANKNSAESREPKKTPKLIATVCLQ